MRRYGEPVRPGIAYRRRLGAYAIVRDGNDLLVAEQRSPVPEYLLPGGGLETGESPVPAVHRECLEETGWRIRIVRRLGVFQRFTYIPDERIWVLKICLVYLARPTLRLGAPSEPDHRALWMPLETAAILLANEGDRSFVAGLARPTPATPARRR